MATDATKKLEKANLTTDHMNRELLVDLYWGEKLSTPELAALFDSNPGTVTRIMEEHGIDSRDLSSAVRLSHSDRNIDFQRIRQLVMKHTGTEIDFTNRQTGLADYVDTLDTVSEVNEPETPDGMPEVEVDEEKSCEWRDSGMCRITDITTRIPSLGIEFTTTEETLLIPSDIDLTGGASGQ